MNHKRVMIYDIYKGFCRCSQERFDGYRDDYDDGITYNDDDDDISHILKHAWLNKYTFLQYILS